MKGYNRPLPVTRLLAYTTAQYKPRQCNYAVIQETNTSTQTCLTPTAYWAAGAP